MANDDKKAQRAIEARPGKKKTAGSKDHPAAGHAKEHLTDRSKTPDAGALPKADEGNIDPGSG